MFWQFKCKVEAKCIQASTGNCQYNYTIQREQSQHGERTTCTNIPYGERPTRNVLVTGSENTMLSVIIVSFIIVVFIADNCVAPVIFIRKSSIVETQNGEIVGMLVEFPRNPFQLRPIEAFYGIIFASSPVGNNRFKPANAYTKTWVDIKDKNTSGSPCFQNVDKSRFKDLPDVTKRKRKRLSYFLTTTSEECLSLNLYRPVNRGKNGRESFAL